MRQERYNEETFGKLNWFSAPSDVKMSVYLLNNILPPSENIECQLILWNCGSSNISVNVYIDAMNTGWEIGEVPDSYQHIQPEVIFLHPEIDVSMSLDCSFRYNQHSVSMTYHIEIENTGSEHIDNLSLATYVLRDNCFILAQDSVPFSSPFHIDEKVSIKNTVRFPNPHSIVNVSSRVIQNYNQIAEILSDPIDLR